MLFSGTGSTGGCGSGIPAAAAPSSPAARRAVGVLAPAPIPIPAPDVADVARAFSAIAISNDDDLVPGLLRIQHKARMEVVTEVEMGNGG